MKVEIIPSNSGNVTTLEVIDRGSVVAYSWGLQFDGIIDKSTRPSKVRVYPWHCIHHIYYEPEEEPVDLIPVDVTEVLTALIHARYEHLTSV